MKIIDLRSDTVTIPTPEMIIAMGSAKVGDDVYGEDPTINFLQEKAADLLGKEDAIFVPSGTQSNLIGIMSHCERGDEYIVGQAAHTYKYEGGGAAVLGSVQPQPIEFEEDGSLDLEIVRSKIKPDNIHFAKTKLFCLENTNWGRVLPMDYIKKANKLAKESKLKFHLDGARLFNAAVKLGIEAREISEYFDSVSICLSKGLGAPVGSLLCADKNTINRARRWRKLLGGGMRQAGYLAAAGIYALDNNVHRLKDDHDNALFLSNELAKIEEIKVKQSMTQTNMVFITINRNDVEPLTSYLLKNGIKIRGEEFTRLVIHLNINREECIRVVSVIKEYFSSTK